MRKKRKKKFRKIRLILLFLLILFLHHLFTIPKSIIVAQISNLVNSSEYKTIKEDTNKNYSGVGQEIVKNKDGYFTTFTTEDVHQKTYKEYKQNGDSSWSKSTYWGGTMADNGCGITAMSIILSGYGKNLSPEDLRKKYYPVLDNQKMSAELSNLGIKNTDFYYDSVHLSKKSLIEHLETNRPILICVWNKPKENRWTEKSHYMALLATDGDMVYVSNPNGGKNDSKSSGWYDFKEITPYLAKALYIESYK